MRTVWDISNNKEKSELAYGKHPTQKPIRILKRMMQLTSREGDVMLTPFSGAGSEYVAAKMTGRKYDLFEEYRLDDAEIAVVCMNSTAGTTKDVVDSLREKGIKAGMLKVRVFRPFPAEEIAKSLSHLKAVAVLDKADSLNGVGGALFEDVVSGMYVNGNNVKALSYVYGIGGRDTTTKEIEQVYTDLQEVADSGKVENPYRYLGLRKE